MGWKGEIRNFRKQQIKDELKDSPSLRNYLSEIFHECYQDSREIISDKAQLRTGCRNRKLGDRE